MLNKSAVALIDACHRGDGAALVTALEGMGEWIITATETAPKTCPAAVVTAARELINQACSAVVEEQGQRFFIRCYVPPRRLFIIGAVHIALALEKTARQVGFRTHIIDPREAFADPERFPDSVPDTSWPDEALTKAHLDRFSAVATLTHDPKIDDAALHVALRSSCFYIGCLGGRKTHAARLERLRAAGFDDALLARIHAPIGLNIGAVGAAEIAIAVAAELIKARRCGLLSPVTSEPASGELS